MLSPQHIAALRQKHRLRQLEALKQRFIRSLDGDDAWATWYFDEFIHLVLSLPAITDDEIYWLMRIGYIQQIRIDNLTEFLTCQSRQKWAGRKIALKLANSELSSQTQKCDIQSNLQPQK